MADAPRFSAQDKHDAASREVGKRKYVYPRLVSEGKLSKPKADREIAVMQEIADDYEKLAAGERLI